MRTFVRIGAALALGGLLAAGQAAGADRVPADAATTQQKAVFVGNLVTRSVSASRIEDSGDAAARAALAEARGLVDAAQADLSAGSVAAADDKLDRALALVNEHVRRLSGGEVGAAHDKRMYERQLNAVNTFLAAYERVAESGASRSARAQAAALRDSIAAAGRKADAGDHAGATALLEQAYQAARGDIRSLRDGKTLTRTLDFATAEEAYDYEIGRNGSYFELLRFAIAEKKPQGSVVGRIEQDREKAEALRREAEGLAGRGDHAAAIGRLEDSTKLLERAIRMSGMFIPG